MHAIKGSVAKKKSGSHKANLLKVLRDDMNFMSELPAAYSDVLSIGMLFMMKSMPIDRTSEYAAGSSTSRQRPTLKKLKDIKDLRLLVMRARMTQIHRKNL